MGLFNFGKKKKEECCCGHGEVSVPENTCDAIGSVKIIGMGCENCHALLENTKKALSSMNKNVEIEYITDTSFAEAYGIKSMPALIVNEQVASEGKILKPNEVIKLLSKMEKKKQ